MAARGTAVATALVQDGGTVPVVGGTANAAGVYIPRSGAHLDRVLVVINSGTTTAGTMIVRATGNGVDTTGASQTSPYPSSAVYAQGAVGDLAVSWATATTTVAGPFTTDRFTQPDGNIYIDWTASGSYGATFTVYQLPFDAI